MAEKYAVRSINLPPTRGYSWWRERSRDLYFLGAAVLSSAWEEKFHDVGLIHKYLCDFLDPNKNPEKKKTVSIFRGSYKTTWLLAYVVYMFCWCLDRGEPMSIVYNTATKENAESFMEEFRQTLLYCELLHWIFPKLPKNDSGYDKFTKLRVEIRPVKFHVASLDTRQVSRHYKIIINDDLVNDDNAFSEVERANLYTKWRLQKAILTRYRKYGVGQEIEVGTPYHHADLMSTLLKSQRGSRFIVPYRVRDESGEWVLTFPEMFTWEDFDVLREDMGDTLFATQYELRVVSEQDRLCREEWLQRFDIGPANYNRYQIVDMGGADEKTNDPTSFVVVDVDENSQLYLQYADEAHLSPTNTLHYAEKIHNTYGCDSTFFEHEKYSIVAADISPIVTPRFQFDFVYTKNRPKPKRIMKLRQYYETGRLQHRKGTTDQADRQALNWPDVDHEGIIEGIAYVLDIMDPPKKNQLRETPQEKDFSDEVQRAIKHAEMRKFGRYGRNMDAYF